MAASRIEEGATALAELGVSDERVADIFDDRAAAHYDDLKVMGPDDVAKVSELFEEVQSLRQENERLRKRTEALEETARSASRSPGRGDGESASTGSSDHETRADGHGGARATPETPAIEEDGGEGPLEGSLVEFAVLVAVLLGIVLISVL